MIYFKNEIAATALLLSLIPAAQANTCFGGDCGIVFDTPIPDMPALTTEYCPSSGSATQRLAAPQNTYTLINQGSTDTEVDLTLTELDDLGDTTAITIDPSSTCTDGGTIDASDSCTVVLNFQPCTTGDLDWDLTVTPISTQRPLVLELTTEVTLPPLGTAYVMNNGTNNSISVCTVNNDGSFALCDEINPSILGDLSVGHLYSIALDPTGVYGYVSMSTGSFTGDMLFCNISDETTIGCTVTADDNFSTTLQGVSYYEDGANGFDYLFVLTQGTSYSAILACPIPVGEGADGLWNPCIVANDSDVLSTALNISLTENGDFAYVTNGSAATVGIFDVTIDDSDPDDITVTLTLSENETDPDVTSPYGVVVAGDDLLVISNNTENSVAVCGINGEGIFDCTDISYDSSFSAPAGMSGLEDTLYVTNMTAIEGVYQMSACDIESFTCTALPDSTFNVPTDIGFIAD